MIDFFVSPVVQTSLIGTMAMALASSIVGCLLLLRRRSLMGETLAHAAFPGLLLGIFLIHFFSDDLFIALTVGGFIFALLGLKCVDWMEKKWKVKPDAALTFVLSVFMGWGILLTSILQKTYPMGYRHALLYLYGQAVTMTTAQAHFYTAFATLLVIFMIVFYSRLRLLLFDISFAQSMGCRSRVIENCIFIWIVSGVILGIRSVGVVLMAGMLIGPAIAARPWTHRFSTLLMVASCVGLASAIMGNVLSYNITTLPAGPMILLSSSFLCFASLLFAPRTGVLSRILRIQVFRFHCKLENSLKLLWKKPALLREISPWIRWFLYFKRWTTKEGQLTSQGIQDAQKIVRLHRLWEVYLVEYLGQNVEKVHQTAEELEHLFTPELEQELTNLLNNPLNDPHHQPIPPMSTHNIRNPDEGPSMRTP